MPHFQPQIADRRQGLFAVAQHEGVDEAGHRLGVGRAGAAGQNQRIGHASATSAARGIPPRSSIVSTFVALSSCCRLKPTTSNSAQRRETLQADQRQSPLPQQRLQVGQRREDPLAGPIAAAVHDRVQHLQAVVAHADRIGLGKGQAEPAPHRRRVFADRVPLAADILPRTLHAGQHAVDQDVSQRRVGHGQLPSPAFVGHHVGHRVPMVVVDRIGRGAGGEGRRLPSPVLGRGAGGGLLKTNWGRAVVLYPVFVPDRHSCVGLGR